LSFLAIDFADRVGQDALEGHIGSINESMTMAVHVNLKKIWCLRWVVTWVGSILLSGCQITPDAGTLVRLEVQAVPGREAPSET